jgi:hypothetical protein
VLFETVVGPVHPEPIDQRRPCRSVNTPSTLRSHNLLDCCDIRCLLRVIRNTP